MAQDPTYASQYYPQLPQRKSKRWLWWLLGIVAVLLLSCGIGSAILIGGTAKVVHNIEVTTTAKKADVKITSCKMDSYGLATVTYTIHNDSGTTQDYFPSFQIEANGTVYGEAADIVSNLAPGKDYSGKAVGSFNGKQNQTGLTCTLVSS